MMLLPGTSRAVVPVLPGALAALRAASFGAIPAALGTGAAATAWPAALLALLGLAAEHPARNMPPPSRTLPIMRPAMAPGQVRPVRVPRRVKLRVFNMPL